MMSGVVAFDLYPGRGSLAACLELHAAGAFAGSCTALLTVEGIEVDPGAAAELDAMPDDELHACAVVKDALVETIARDAVSDRRHRITEAAVEVFTRSTADELARYASRLHVFAREGQASSITSALDQVAASLRAGDQAVAVVIVSNYQHVGGPPRG